MLGGQMVLDGTGKGDEALLPGADGALVHDTLEENLSAVQAILDIRIKVRQAPLDQVFSRQAD